MTWRGVAELATRQAVDRPSSSRHGGALVTVDQDAPAAGREADVPLGPAVPGVTVLDDNGVKWQRRSVLVITLVPFIGFVLAVGALWGRGLTAVDASIALFFYAVTALGVTIGFHRLFTHRSFEAVRPLKIVLAIAGSMSLQGSLIDWVAAHRRHHAFSDKEGDPHSPHLDEGEGAAGVIRGLWHAHIGWLVSPERTDLERWAPDLLKDEDLLKIHRSFPLLTLATFVLPGLLGFAITRSIWGGVTAFLWGSLARIFFLHHVTWSINSVCHFYGKRPFRSRDFSTNNWVLSIVSFGESWHNNHHAFPTSAVHGIGRGQIDVSARLIRIFESLRWARSVKLVSPGQLAAKAQTAFAVRKTWALSPVHGDDANTGAMAETARGLAVQELH
ncbi:MAG: acyl-CoA desaturase [Actinomycetota bacterium]